ncbi:MAG TPA: MFS transporter [Candidatus Limnocylindrales bacterium]|jgi:MFS family permease|nr:MFS transporter [Candidatus Limnocylindrales bacterium]
MSATTRSEPVRLGLRANLGQFVLLVAVNSLVGGMVGQERSVLPLLATGVFGVTGVTAILTYLLAFGVTKAGANLLAGALADRYGRKPVLVVGWLIGLPVPLLLIWAPAWGWIVAANVLLGLNQGLTWSTTVIMKIDLVGPTRRGLAMGLNEAAGYGAVALTALATGAIAEQAGLRPGPFLVGLAYAGLGLGASVLLVRETRSHVDQEQSDRPSGDRLAWREIFLRTTVREPSLSAACQAGLVNNLNDGMAWGLLPLYYATTGLSIAEIGILAAAYPAVWAIGQIGTGALSDRIGRKRLIVAGMLLQAAAIAVIAAGSSFGVWLAAAVILGLGTALVYPTLIAAIADVAEPTWRGSAVGVYRLWRDLGFAAGAIVAGLIADAAGIASAIWVVAAITAASGVVVLIRMRETRSVP